MSAVSADHNTSPVAYRSARLRVGDYEIDVLRRLVSGRDGGTPRRVTIKALHVLLVLVEAEGGALSREQLLARVWPRTLPSDDVLTQAVTQLRKAFQDDRDEPHYIETIAKLGYRLVAPAQWLEDVPANEPQAPVVQLAPACPAPAPAPAPSTQEDVATVVMPPRARWLRPALAVLLPLLVAACLWGWRGRGGDAAPATMLALQALTSETAIERTPSLSPDGQWLAFSQQGGDGDGHGLQLRRVDGSQVRMLTEPVSGQRDHWPAWSRDGARLAFVRETAAGCRIVVMVVDSGSQRDIAACQPVLYPQLDWSPDGSALVMAGSAAPDQAPHLRRLDLASGQWQALDYPVTPRTTDLMPRFSPDGQWLGFRRGISTADLWLMPATGGQPRQLTRLSGDIRGWDWLPDGSGLVFSQIKDEVRLYRYDLASGAITQVSEVGRADPVFPDIAADSWAMVMELVRQRTEMVRVPLQASASASGSPHPELLAPSSGVDLMPSISPDGQTLAFVSDRSLTAQLWIGEPTRASTLRAVPDLVPVPRHPPEWSADGQHLLVIAGTAGEPGDAVYEIDAATLQAHRLPLPASTPLFAAYAGDPAQLLVALDEGHGRIKLVLYDRNGWRELAGVEDASLARYDARHDRICFSRPTRAGIWCANARLESVTQIANEFPAKGRYRDWLYLDGQLHAIAEHGQCKAALLPLEGRTVRPPRCVFEVRTPMDGSPTADASGQWLYLARSVDHNVDIGWASLATLHAGARK